MRSSLAEKARKTKEQMTKEEQKIQKIKTQDTHFCFLAFDFL
jgi:hypothetical protein